MILDLGPESCVAHRGGAGGLAHAGLERALSAPSRSCPSTAPPTTCARAAARLTEARAQLLSVAGGGDTVAALQSAQACSAPSATSPPPAAPSWNGWRGRTLCRAWRRSKPRATREPAMSARRPRDRRARSRPGGSARSVRRRQPGSRSRSGLRPAPRHTRGSASSRAVFEQAGEAVPEADHDVGRSTAGASAVLAHEALSRSFASRRVHRPRPPCGKTLQRHCGRRRESR